MTHITNNRGSYWWIALIPVTSLLLGGCTARIADLTMVSTKNIDLSDTRLDAKTGQRYTGEDCGYYLLGLIPLRLQNLKEAIDQAIEKGKGNVMVDQVTEFKVADMLLVEQQCLKVEGTVLTAPVASKPFK